MSIIPSLLRELEQEAQTTRKMLERVPDEKYTWQPHEKSMSLQRLVTHIGELPLWIAMALNTDGLDFAANPYDPAPISNTKDLLEFFETSLQEGRDRLMSAKEEDLLPEWTLRNGENILLVRSKGEVIRMTFSQIVHHRAQLGVYLRLLNIPIPGSYGPSADEIEEMALHA